ncbi:hypothetical protein DFJ73DRAFT_259578 [Zopfochytrium polystomum]|nr:hypothetical protein DFJ73DRAFT_259578 [Zopfochytrium polystomum]
MPCPTCWRPLYVVLTFARVSDGRVILLLQLCFLLAVRAAFVGPRMRAACSFFLFCLPHSVSTEHSTPQAPPISRPSCLPAVFLCHSFMPFLASFLSVRVRRYEMSRGTTATAI